MLSTYLGRPMCVYVYNIRVNSEFTKLAQFQVHRFESHTVCCGEDPQALVISRKDTRVGVGRKKMPKQL